MISTCTEMLAVSDVCARFLSEEVGLADIDPALWEASYRDPRVTTVAALEPGFVWGMAPENLAELIGSVSLTDLGDIATRFIDTDFETSGFAALLPERMRAGSCPATISPRYRCVQPRALRSWKKSRRSRLHRSRGHRFGRGALGDHRAAAAHLDL